MKQIIPHFTETIFYSIEQIARYLELNGKDFFSSITKEVTPEEFKTLDVILSNADICQRDLAKLILKDRVRTGRILENLEQKGLIKRFNHIKNNRLVRKMKVTQKGEKLFYDLSEKMQPYLKNIYEKFSDNEVKELNNLLNLLKDALSSTVKLEV